jgi:glycosyltransferase involved in cell wall biosynthesis
MDKKPLRSVLRIPEERFIVLLSAWHVRDRRKGVQYAVEALKRLVPTPYLLVVGHCDSDAKPMFSRLDACFTGHVTSEVLLAQYYAAADVFLSPSIADNLPNVILETMATGTPTIAFRAGGIPDMIDHDDNGWLAEVGDVAGLVLGLQKAMSSSETLRRWGEASVRKAKGTFSENRFLTNYLELYKSVMNQ